MFLSNTFFLTVFTSVSLYRDRALNQKENPAKNPRGSSVKLGLMFVMAGIPLNKQCREGKEDSSSFHSGAF
ncbi:hypothetical protein NQZ68_002993 [Dissostichus eleginoides]|nr:hypothetical protein NQZ68_002993 [Dissostichus eleginoides]